MTDFTSKLPDYFNENYPVLKLKDRTIKFGHNYGNGSAWTSISQEAAKRSVFVTIGGAGATSDTIGLDETKAFRDTLNVIIEEIEARLPKEPTFQEKLEALENGKYISYTTWDGSKALFIKIGGKFVRLNDGNSFHADSFREDRATIVEGEK